jgi:chorismate mutase/prephenate dehydratase
MSLDDHRKRIDEIDVDLVRLLNERIRQAQAIGSLKNDAGQEVFVPVREREVLERVTGLNEGPLRDSSLTAIYREIFSAAISLEREVIIAYLGPDGTFTHQAARSRFGASVGYAPATEISDVFSAVEKKTADYGVVPIENSTEGSVNPTLDELVGTPLRIYAEIMLPVEHQVLSHVTLPEIRKVYSHPQVFGQCRHWLAANLPNAEQVPSSSTARASELAASEIGAAAIASELAGEIHGLPVQQSNVEDKAGNATRFLVIARSTGQVSGRDKTSVVFRVRHRVGALYEALASFRRADLNMMKIESRPSRQKAWEYWFFVDFQGHADEPVVEKALADLGEHCVMLTVLGSYPMAFSPSGDDPAS